MKNKEHSNLIKVYKDLKLEYQALLDEKSFIKRRLEYLIKSGESYNSIIDLIEYNNSLTHSLNSISKLIRDCKEKINYSQKQFYLEEEKTFNILTTGMFNATVKAFMKSFSSGNIGINPLFPPKIGFYIHKL